MKITLVAFTVLLINIPFGYWRSKVRKISPQWFFAVHLPVPIVIIIRIYSNIGFQLYTYPLLVGAFFLGQYLGGKINFSNSSV